MYSVFTQICKQFGKVCLCVFINVFMQHVCDSYIRDLCVHMHTNSDECNCMHVYV